MINRFIILGTQRTGSGALANALRLHPYVFCGFEWTQNTLPWNSVHIAEEALHMNFRRLSAADRRDILECRQRPVRQIGFKHLFRSSDKWLGHPRLSPALILDALYPHLSWLKREKDIRVIHLSRANNLQWLKSKYLSSITGNYRDGQYGDVKIKIPVRASVKRVIAKNYLDHRLSTLSMSNSYIRVFYEDFLRDSQEVTQRLLEFLGEDPRLLPELRDKVRKPQSTKLIQEYVENFDDLSLALELRGLKYSK